MALVPYVLFAFPLKHSRFESNEDLYERAECGKITS